MEKLFEEEYNKLSPEERTLVYNRGILASLLDHEFNNNKYTLLSKIKEDPDLYNIQNIKHEKVALNAAKNKIFEMKSIEDVMKYGYELGLIEPEEYKTISAASLTPTD
jgi:hypothetical protein